MSEPTTAATTVQFTEEQVKRFAEIERENAELKKANEATMAEAKQDAERVAKLENDARRKAFAEIAKDWQGDISEIVSFMEAIPASALEFFRKREDAHAEQIRQGGLFSEKGVAGRTETEDPATRLDSLVKAKMASEKMTYRDAARLVMNEHPDLAASQRKMSEVRVGN